MRHEHEITIRPATTDDTAALLQLAALDDRPAPRGDALLAFVDGELAAARPLDGRRGPVADPFRHTAHLLDLLEIQSRALVQA
jgi:hypothetical protein